MIRKYGRKLSATQSGQELVEMAILLPLLLLIVFGVLDLGRVFHAAITITNAAREGARYGMTHSDDPEAIIAATLNEAENSGVDLSTSIVEVSCPDGCGRGLPLRVAVQYHFSFIMVGLVFPDPTLTITRAAEMRVP